MNTTTKHEHNEQSYSMIDEMLDTQERCECDWYIVGGPIEHSGERYIEHLRSPSGCVLALVCAAHLPYSLTFLPRECDELDSIEIETLTDESQIANMRS